MLQLNAANTDKSRNLIAEQENSTNSSISDFINLCYVCKIPFLWSNEGSSINYSSHSHFSAMAHNPLLGIKNLHGLLGFNVYIKVEIFPCFKKTLSNMFYLWMYTYTVDTNVGIYLHSDICSKTSLSQKHVHQRNILLFHWKNFTKKLLPSWMQSLLYCQHFLFQMIILANRVNTWDFVKSKCVFSTPSSVICQQNPGNSEQNPHDSRWLMSRKMAEVQCLNFYTAGYRPESSICWKRLLVELK